MHDNKLIGSLRSIIREEVDAVLADLLSKAGQSETDDVFQIEDYRDDIETMISEYINYNVTVTLEG